MIKTSGISVEEEFNQEILNRKHNESLISEELKIHASLLESSQLPFIKRQVLITNNLIK